MGKEEKESKSSSLPNPLTMIVEFTLTVASWVIRGKMAGNSKICIGIQSQLIGHLPDDVILLPLPESFRVFAFLCKPGLLLFKTPWD